MAPNPNAVQLLHSKYQAYGQLLQARADIDTKLIIVATDINQITSAAMANAAVASIPTEPEQQVKEEKGPQPATEVAKPEPTPEPVVETPSKVVEEPTVTPEEPTEGGKPVEYEVIQDLVAQIVANPAMGAAKVQPIAVAAGGPYTSLDVPGKLKMEASLREVLANG